MANTFLLGKASLRRGDNINAVKQLSEALACEPHNPYIRGYHAWAKYVTAKNAGVGGVPKRHARTTLRDCVMATKDFDAGWAFLGKLYLDEGNSKNAGTAFRNALRINADNDLARRGAQAAERRKSGVRRDSWVDRLKKITGISRAA